ALQEMREERGPQWLLAVEYLEAVLVYDLASHGHFFAEQGGLALVMAELPYGQVDAVYPLLVAVLRLQLRSHGCGDGCRGAGSASPGTLGVVALPVLLELGTVLA
ncbi:unnamed protein product, partial [Effrenium voratum]